MTFDENELSIKLPFLLFPNNTHLLAASNCCPRVVTISLHISLILRERVTQSCTYIQSCCITTVSSLAQLAKSHVRKNRKRLLSHKKQNRHFRQGPVGLILYP